MFPRIYCLLLITSVIVTYISTRACLRFQLVAIRAQQIVQSSGPFNYNETLY